MIAPTTPNSLSHFDLLPVASSI